MTKFKSFERVLRYAARHGGNIPVAESSRGQVEVVPLARPGSLPERLELARRYNFAREAIAARKLEKK